MSTLHFGIVPKDQPGGLQPARIDGHTDPETEHEIGHAIGGNAIVDGSWTVWGTYDQGDDQTPGSLHVTMDLPGEVITVDLVTFLGRRLAQHVEAGRLLDYVLVTPSNDHSLKTHVITYGVGGITGGDGYVINTKH